MKTSRTVAQVLSGKSKNQILTTQPSERVFNALRKMALYNVGALLVTQGDELLGLFSERDYARKIVLKNRTSRDTFVAEVMEPEIPTVDPECTVESCLELMNQHKIMHIPVIEHGHLAGVISRGDVMRDLLQEHRFMVEQLTAYVMNSYTSDSSGEVLG